MTNRRKNEHALKVIAESFRSKPVPFSVALRSGDNQRIFTRSSSAARSAGYHRGGRVNIETTILRSGKTDSQYIYIYSQGFFFVHGLEGSVVKVCKGEPAYSA